MMMLPKACLMLRISQIHGGWGFATDPTRQLTALLQTYKPAEECRKLPFPGSFHNVLKCMKLHKIANKMPKNRLWLELCPRPHWKRL